MATEARPVEPTNDREKAIATLVAAFFSEAVTRWIYPDAAQYLNAFPRLAAALGARAFDNGSVYASTDHSGVALWLGPGVEPDRQTLKQLLDERDQAASVLRREELQGFSSKQRDAHSKEPHWYLALLGVDPSYQGRGFGSGLLGHALTVVDQSGLPAYLEATNLNNRRLYERHGFVVVSEIQYGSSPTMYGMRREPR
jgi:ribosomal protein S18 acetylase RimI-like enzyme